jgi:hypothetical protein
MYGILYVLKWPKVTDTCSDEACKALALNCKCVVQALNDTVSNDLAVEQKGMKDLL